MLATLPAVSGGTSQARSADVRSSNVGSPEGLRLPVETITRYDAFVALEAEWNDAVARAAVPHPFLRHEWVRTWWDTFAGSAQLHLVVVRDQAGIITAIAPLMRESTRMYGVPVTRLRLLQNDHTPRTDVIVASRPAESYDAIWRTIRERGDWDVLQLNQLLRTSPTLTTIAGFARAEGLATGTWPSSESPYLDLTGNWDDYLASLPAKFRSNLRNRMSRLTKLGEPALEVLRDRAAIEQGYADALRLEASGWKEREGTSIGSDPAVQRFYTLLTERATAQGWLELLFLKVGDRRIATSYGSTYDGRLFLFKTGYDPEYATCAPFKLLTSLAIRRAYEQGLREVDFLGDSEPWKREWTASARAHDWLFVFAETRRARLLHSIKFEWVPELKRWRA
jgi:CelD/BcsL family acetyltransferase involved in cellulose biosynthesis